MCEEGRVYEKQQKERRRKPRGGSVAEKAMEGEAAWWQVTCSSIKVVSKTGDHTLSACIFLVVGGAHL